MSRWLDGLPKVNGNSFVNDLQCRDRSKYLAVSVFIEIESPSDDDQMVACSTRSSPHVGKPIGGGMA